MGGHPWLGLLLGLLSGALAGIFTGFFQTVLKIHPILAGILTMSGLYSVNIFIMGASNLSLLTGTTVYKELRELMPFLGKEGVKIALSAFFALLLFLILAVFFRTKLGLRIRATGDNEEMVRSSSIDADRSRILGIMLSNALVGLSGALLCEQQRYADLNFGSGMLVVGLASVIIGQVFFGQRGITLGIVSAVAGSLAYRIILQLAYKIDMPSYAVKLLSAVIVVLALSVPPLRRKLAERRADRAEEAEP